MIRASLGTATQRLEQVVAVISSIVAFMWQPMRPCPANACQVAAHEACSHLDLNWCAQVVSRVWSGRLKGLLALPGTRLDDTPLQVYIAPHAGVHNLQSDFSSPCRCHVGYKWEPSGAFTSHHAVGHASPARPTHACSKLDSSGRVNNLVVCCCLVAGGQTHIHTAEQQHVWRRCLHRSLPPCFSTSWQTMRGRTWSLQAPSC
jgi:hypothetical protein